MSGSMSGAAAPSLPYGMPTSDALARLVAHSAGLPQHVDDRAGPSSDASYSMTDRRGYFRNDEFRFGHHGPTFYFDRVQDGVTKRHSEGTVQTDPSLAAGVSVLEEKTRSVIDEPVPRGEPRYGDYSWGSGYYSGSSRSSRNSLENYVDIAGPDASGRLASVRRYASGGWGGSSSVRDAEVAAEHLNDRATPVAGTDGGEASGGEKFLKVAVPVVLVGAALAFALSGHGSRYGRW
ncbi:MAG: hypothetical protein JWM98_716 [Thermoleophilia bacterium]|nr:hypothetical protein [Thermoleophilia bacterium]